MRQVHFEYLAFALDAWKATPYITRVGDARERSPDPNTTETTMKMIASVVVALSLLTGVVSTASAFDAKSFYEQLDRSSF